MMHGREKSDLAIVAMKPANKANEPTAEASTGANAAVSVERRAGPRGKRISKARTGLRARVACQRRWSVYGDLFETHVPTATTTRVRHATSRRGARSPIGLFMTGGKAGQAGCNTVASCSTLGSLPGC